MAIAVVTAHHGICHRNPSWMDGGSHFSASRALGCLMYSGAQVANTELAASAMDCMFADVGCAISSA
jgi:hypothetical protein